MKAFLLLLPLLVSSSFLGESLVKDHELDTALEVNGAGWSKQRGILYTYELTSPQQEAVKKGIVLSTDFSSEDPTANLMMKTTLVVGSTSKQVYVFPFRNMQAITCSDTGWNRLELYAKKTSYHLWVDLWGDDCRTLASQFDSVRMTRQSKLSQAVKDLSGYANSYITAMQEVANFEAQTNSIENSMNGQNFAIKTTELTIGAFQDQTKAKEQEIAGVMKDISDLNTKVNNLNINILQNQNKVDGLEDSIKKLEGDETSSEDAKETYDKNAADSLKLIEDWLKQLIVEAPTAKELQGLVANLKANKDLTAFDGILRSILPS